MPNDSTASKTPNEAWHIYIVKCCDGSYYTGITTDLERRIDEHNNSPLGARYTRSRRPVTLHYHESSRNRSEALKRELAIKKLPRKKKHALKCHVVITEPA